MQRMSEREYAAHSGVSRGAVQKAKSANEVLKAQERRLQLAKLKSELVDRDRATASPAAVFGENEPMEWPISKRTLRSRAVKSFSLLS